MGPSRLIGPRTRERSMPDRSRLRTSPEESVQLADLPMQAAAYVLAELEHSLVGDRVAGEVAVLRAGHEAGPEQHAQVLGHVLLRGAGGLLQLLHGRVVLAERVEQLDPHRLAEYPEALRDQVHERVGKGMGNFDRLGHGGENTTTTKLYVRIDVH